MAREGLIAAAPNGQAGIALKRAVAAVRRLPSTFTYSQARAAGLDHRSLYGLRDAGVIEAVARGLYRQADAAPVDPTLAQVAARTPAATLCLTSALVAHDLTDARPDAPHLAVPRGTRFPVVSGPATWHAFAVSTFHVGRGTLAIDDDLSLGLYGPERTIVDSFRMRHLIGRADAHEALRRWLRRRHARPDDLLKVAAHFPRSVAALRHALEILA